MRLSSRFRPTRLSCRLNRLSLNLQFNSSWSLVLIFIKSNPFSRQYCSLHEHPSPYRWGGYPQTLYGEGITTKPWQFYPQTGSPWVRHKNRSPKLVIVLLPHSINRQWFTMFESLLLQSGSPHETPVHVDGAWVLYCWFVQSARLTTRA